MNTFTFNLFGDPTLKYALENDSFSISSSRYSDLSLKMIQFLKYNLLKGEDCKKDIDLAKYNSFQNGFIYKPKRKMVRFGAADFPGLERISDIGAGLSFVESTVRNASFFVPSGIM